MKKILNEESTEAWKTFSDLQLKNCGGLLTGNSRRISTSEMEPFVNETLVAMPTQSASSSLGDFLSH